MNASTVFYAVVSGALVFVVGQIILQFVIVPVQEFFKTIAAIGRFPNAGRHLHRL